MGKPQDIAFVPWNRRTSDAWTNAAFRAPVLAFMRELGAWGWVTSWEVTERFAASGIDIRTPSLPVVLHEPVERAGVKLLVLAVVRGRDRQRLEVALSFPRGVLTPQLERTTLLTRARESILAQHRSTL